MKAYLVPFLILATAASCTRAPGVFDSDRARLIWPGMNMRSTGETEFEGEASGKKLKLSVYEKAPATKAARILELETARLRNLYRTDILPYHGAISRQTGCESGEKPKFQESTNEVRIQLLTNERLVPGNCDSAQAFYRASFRFLYCEKDQRVFLLRVYTPKGVTEQTAPVPEVEALKCGPS